MGQLINMMYFVMVPELSKPNGAINKHHVLYYVNSSFQVTLNKQISLALYHWIL